MPENAEINIYGDDWTCKYGFKRIGNECKQVGGLLK
jgi:hypothetical protein